MHPAHFTVGAVVIAILIVVVLCWIVSLLPLPASAPPWTRNVLYLIVALICLAWLLDAGGCGLGLNQRLF